MPSAATEAAPPGQTRSGGRDGQEQPTVDAGRKKPQKPSESRKFAAALRDFSVTVAAPAADITDWIWSQTNAFLQRDCRRGLFAKQRAAAAAGPLRARGVISMVCTGGAPDVESRLRERLGERFGAFEGRVAVKPLSQKGIRTFLGMIGCCLRDEREAWFLLGSKHVTQGMLEEGRVQLALHGPSPLKHMRAVGMQDLFERAVHFCKSHGGAEGAGGSLKDTLLRMMRSGHFYPSPEWVMPEGGGPMDVERVEALWQILRNPKVVTPHMVNALFFQGERGTPPQSVDPDLTLRSTN